MRKIILFALLLAGPLAGFAKPNPADYPVTIHVQSAKLIYNYHAGSSVFHANEVLRLEAAIGGKKYELEGDTDLNILKPGDYKARITKDEPVGDYEYQRTYEFLFSDGQTLKFRVVGESD